MSAVLATHEELLYGDISQNKGILPFSGVCSLSSPPGAAGLLPIAIGNIADQGQLSCRHSHHKLLINNDNATRFLLINRCRPSYNGNSLPDEHLSVAPVVYLNVRAQMFPVTLRPG